MDVDESPYLNIDADEFLDVKVPNSADVIIKKTLFPSPIFVNIFAQFKVCVSKPFRGLSSLSLNDEEYQTLIPVENNSQLDAFSDDDNEEDLLQLNDSNESLTKGETTPVFEHVKVIVKSKSIVIDSIEFKTTVEIRCANLIRGRMNLHGTDEDSLFISLKSGYLLLIRLFLVPRNYKDSDYMFQTTSIKHDGSSIFKPFVVQWWDTSNDLSIPSLQTSGYQLSSDRLGLSVVSTAAYRSFRIYNTESTINGIILRKHFNVGVDGLIMHSCFAEPFDRTSFSNHVSFLALVYTDNHRLCLQLFSWSNSQTLEHNISKTTLPLDNTFKIPIFIAPLRSNGAFLFVLEDELVLVTIHQIISAEYNFKRFQTPWKNSSFPTNYYTPESNILNETTSNEEILISTDAGLIYSFQLNDENLAQITPILRVPNSISVFALEKGISGYSFIFGSDTDNNQELLIPELFSEDYVQGLDPSAKIKYSQAKLVQNYSNWSPLIDVQIIESTRSAATIAYSSEELWGLTGNGKRSRITQFRSGYSANRKSKIYEKLRKCCKMFLINLIDVTYLLCSFPFETILVEYQSGLDYSFLEIEDVKISDPTLFATSLTFQDDEYILYITPSVITLTNFTDFTISSNTENRTILMSKVKDNSLVLITETILDEKIMIEIELFDINNSFHGNSDSSMNEVIKSVQRRSINYEPSVLCLAKLLNELVLITGGYDGRLYYYRLNDLEEVKVQVLRDFCPYKNLLPFTLQSLIPNDITAPEKGLYIGTKDGFYVELDQEDLKCTKFLRLSGTPVHFGESTNDNPLSLFIHSKTMWMLNLNESMFPERVFFEETFERTIMTIAKLPKKSSSGKLEPENIAVIRDDGLLLASIMPFKEPNLRQVSIGERAHKLQYFSNSSLFIILCKSKNPNGRLRFVDKKSLKVLPHWEMKLKSKESDEDPIFDQNEIPTASCIWFVKRQNRISKKLLLGCALEVGSNQQGGSSGSIKVLDILKSKSHSDLPSSVRVLELTSFRHPYPVTHIRQVDDVILFTSGSSIYSTSYDMENKKLKAVSCLKTLSSEITWLEVQNNYLLVTTKFDSVFQFSYTSKDGELDLQISYSDPCTNSYINHTRFGSNIFAGDKLHSSISIFNEHTFSQRTTFRVSCIARVFSSNFRCSWDNEDEEDKIVLCVGVNGEIFSILLAADDDAELKQLATTMNKAINTDLLLADNIERLKIPFLNKVSGTGLLSINKPSFDYKENKGKLIDYDLDDISNYCPVNICI